MSRPLRIEFQGAYYHIMNRGVAYQDVFADRSDRELFLDLLSECHEMWGIRVLAYCLLDNHYHLLIQTPQANLSRVMRHLDGLRTQRYNRRHQRDGPLFRGRYKAIVVDGEEYLLEVARYIHRNPVKAGLVRYPEAYPWSSCRVYGKGGRHPEWLDVGELLGRFPKRDRRGAFLAFMGLEVEGPVKMFYESKQCLAVLGSQGFIERIGRGVRKRQTDLKEVPEAKLYIRFDVKRCLEVVGRVYGNREEDLKMGRRGQRNEARAMAMYVCRRLCGMKQEEIAKVFGVGGYSGVSSMIGRVRGCLNEEGRCDVGTRR